MREAVAVASITEARKRRAVQLIRKRKEDAEWYSARLQCYLRSVHVRAPGCLVIEVAEGGCTDMEGALELAYFVMPDVRLIVVYSGEVPDVVYRRVNGAWHAEDAVPATSPAGGGV